MSEAPGSTEEVELSPDAVLWKQLESDPRNFELWTGLVTACEALDNLDKIKQAILALLEQFPLCFGYWKRLATRLHKHGLVEEAFSVFESGVQATPHSHQLWTAYLDIVSKLGNTTKIRELYIRATEAIGHEHDIKAVAIWEKYLEFETTDEKITGSSRLLNALYVRLLQVPIPSLPKIWEQFQTFAATTPLQELVLDGDAALFRSENEVTRRRFLCVSCPHRVQQPPWLCLICACLRRSSVTTCSQRARPSTPEQLPS
jgi:pre-mRNA-processing factor 39